MRTNLNSTNLESLTREIGSHWTKKGDRYYLSEKFLFETIELEYGCYKTGNIAWARLEGYKISNCECRRILGSLERIWVNLENGELMGAPERFEEQLVEAINNTLKA